MKIHESIDIGAPPQAVWAQLVDPQLLADWHVKLVEVRRTVRGPVHVGERFGTSYVMNAGRRDAQQAEAEVTRCDPWTTLELRHHFHVDGRARYVDEVFALQPRCEGRETRVTQSVDLAGAGIPLWLRALMWCIMRTGEPKGEGILEPLKRVCEAAAAGTPGRSDS
jgi:uncharacterized protein YndB with AHSA1/START domain